MFDKLDDAFQFHSQALQLRQQRQTVLANNIANADTPNFKAQDFDFSRQLASAVGRPGASGAGAQVRMATTAEGHLSRSPQGGANYNLDLAYRVPAQPSLDGNTVEMDRERAEFMDNSVRYQASLVMIKGYLQGLKSALQPE
ncbi:flagellar basal body rod protein FlgB [Mangrovimicrobium sediminis]|uniref:Flagellar basal body rod protein FlgB n=1 Tax=Mangrovimicrobium sediminis TaxID=2562682 RepID=A0A4Z0M0D8_9GAMM|nr:flagellar basal body rod protein FlgB [Haliea sp. SAOS-164]TGD73133.1 flagellar basal body rod protein FlgB [Haliea sp. SAOS-164]